MQNPTGLPMVEAGVLDLRGLALDDRSVIPLNGEWEFYPGELVEPEVFEGTLMMEDKQYLLVPGNWDSSVNDKEDGYSYGTYRLRILVDDQAEVLQGIRLASVRSAFRLFVDGQLVGGKGEVAEEKINHLPVIMPFYTTFFPKHEEIELVLQVSHATGYWETGGIAKPIRFGGATAIEWQKWFAILTQLIVVTVLLIDSV